MKAMISLILRCLALAGCSLHNADYEAAVRTY